MKPPPQGAAPAPCQPPLWFEAFVLGQEKFIARWWKRIRPNSTSPKAATTELRPAFALARRLSLGSPSPQPLAEQVLQATSSPGHSSEPSPSVKVSSQVFQFIEPELSKTTSSRARMSSGVGTGSVSSGSTIESQPGSPPKSTKVSPSLSASSSQTPLLHSVRSLVLLQSGSAVSTRPSPSLSSPSPQAGVPPSVVSFGLEHSRSSGKSMSPSPSLSMPSEHATSTSLRSRALAQPGSAGKSVKPSPSSSMPLEQVGTCVT